VVAARRTFSFGFCLFTSDFIEDIPKRLAGLGRFRFIL